MSDWAWPPVLVLRLLQRGTLVLLLLVAGSAPAGRGAADAPFDAFLANTTRRWCGAHGARADLQAVVIDVRFRAEPPLFAPGEGVVVAPLAIDLPGGQRVMEVASEPTQARGLKVQGITAVAWEYGGRVRRDLRFTGVALVERPPLVRVNLPERPAFEGLPTTLRPEALARAADLEEHGLEKCAGFSEWARRTAGGPPHTDQVLRLVRAVARPADETKREAEDLCADLRVGRFTRHRAQVAAVLGARELGIPALGFASAGSARYLVGTYVDNVGWVLADVERPDQDWFTGGPALVTMAPLLGAFPASAHAFWSPEGAAYTRTGWGVTPLSTTEWRDPKSPPASTEPPTDTTEARAVPLSEVCG
jgi:hypothetical protein